MLKFPTLLNIPSPFTSLARRLFSKRGAKRRDERGWSCPEALEVRYVLAASISATLSDGLLTITDTAGADNSLTVTVDGDDLVITDDTEQFISAPAGATLSNGDRTLTVPIELITAGFTLNSGGGNDNIEFSPLELAMQGNLIVDGGAGTDELMFAGGSIELATGGLFATADQIYSGASVMASGAVRLNANGADRELSIEAPITAGADSALIADQLRLVGQVDVGGHVLTIAPDSTGDSNDAIDIGDLGSGSPNSLKVTISTLSLITAEAIVVGDANTGTIKIHGAMQSDTHMEVVTGRNIVFTEGSRWLAVNGNLSFVANATGTTEGNFTGIEVNNAEVISLLGSLTLNGHGGASVDGSGNRGVAVTNGSVIQSGTLGLTIEGTGGLGQDSSYGVEIDSSTVVTYAVGGIQITGIGGDSAYGYGVWVRNGSELAAAGPSKITLHGTGGNAGAGRGVVISGEDAVSRVHSVDGDITITGIGGATDVGDTTIGVVVHQGAQVESTGTAKIIIDGTGGASLEGSRGVQVGDAGTKITSATGDIQITGHGADTVHGFGIWVHSGAAIESTETAKITLNGTGGASGGNDIGILFGGFGSGGATLSSLNGNISLTGIGGKSIDQSYSAGLVLAEGTVIESTGTASITLNGTGGLGQDSSRGVEIGDLGTQVTSAVGDIEITGVGGDNAYGYGIWVRSGAVVESTGSAKVNLHGTGGDAHAGRGVVIGGEGAVSRVHSVDGDITITGIGGETEVGTTTIGVYIERGVQIESTGTAKILIDGTGGASLEGSRGIEIVGSETTITSAIGDIEITGHAAATVNGFGIWLHDGALIESTDTARITLDGTAGASGGADTGLLIGYFGGAKVSSVNGDVHLIGSGGGSVNDSGSPGITLMDGTVIESTGTAQITLNGTGGVGQDGSRGIEMLQAGTKITSATGDILLTGQGGADVHGFGIWVYGGASITSTDTAKITLNGTGGTVGGNDSGIMFGGFGNGGATVSSVNGDISLIGVGGDTLDGTFSRGIGLFEETLIESTGTADITINGTGGDGVNTLRGVEIGDGARVITQHGGDIVITGQGGASVSSSVTYNEGVLIRHGAVIESTATEGTAGKIQITGVSGQGAGRDVGVRITGDAHVKSSRGDITITGQSGSDNGDNNHGIFVEDGSTVESSDSAKITLDGTGKGATISLGVYILGTDSAIRSVQGDILVTGQGGDGGHINIGVTVDYAAVIESTGTAKVTVQGTGGAGSDGNHGVRLYGDGSFIRSAVGDIEVTGISGAGTTDSNNGVILEVGGAIVSSGTAKIKVTGTAGTGTFHPGNGIGQAGVWLLGSGSKITSQDGDIEIIGFGSGSPGSSGNHGVAIQSGTVATSGTANVLITGTPGVGPVSFGVQLQSSTGSVAIDSSAGTGSITITSDSLDIDFVSRPTSINAGTGVVTIAPKTAGTPVKLGSIDSDGVLALADGEFKRITAGTLIIGDSSAGTITVTSDIATLTPTNLQLVSGGDLVISGGQIDTQGGTLLLNSGAAPDVVNPSHAGVDVSTSTSTLGGDLLIAINGTAVDSGYTQFHALGGVNLNGVQLQLAGSYIPTPGQTFVIVNNDSNDAVSGIFQGLPEGTIFLFNGRSLQISYVGGSGNDVVLTTVNLAPVAVNGALTVLEDTPTTGTLVATDVDSSSLTYSIVTPPAHGTVLITNSATGAFIYTPTANYNGADSFTFEASDGLLDSASATVSITVEATNDAPQLELNGGPVTFSAKAARKNGPVVVLPNVTVSDPDESDSHKLGGGTLTLTLDISARYTRNKVKPHDTLGTLISPTTIGAPPLTRIEDGKLIYTVQLHSTTTAADVENFLRGLTFSTKGPGLKVTPRALRVQLTDAAGAASNVLQQTITVTK